MEGLEPACLSALDPKSSASTSFATSACFIIINNLFSECNKKISEKISDCKMPTIINNRIIPAIYCIYLIHV